MLPLLPLLAACVPLSTVGLVTDGALPMDGQSRALAHGGVAGVLPEGPVELAHGGLGYERGIGDRRSVYLGLASLAPWEPTVLAHSELRRRWSQEGRRVQVVSLGGAGVTYWGWMFYGFGFHGGALGSVRLGEWVRVYAGAKVNPSVVPSSFNVHGVACVDFMGEQCYGRDLWGVYTMTPIGASASWERLRLGMELQPVYHWGANGDYGFQTLWYGSAQAWASWTF